MKNRKNQVRRYSTLLCVTLCVVLFTKALSTIWISNTYHTHQVKAEIASGIDRPMSLSIEPLRPVRTHFENSAHYQISGDEEEWDRLIPGDGTVRIGPPSRDTQEYTLSIYHQLRCLNLIRKNIIEVEHRQLHEPDFNAIMSSTQHCINYLREMVLCRSDLDLETIAGRPKADIILNQYQCWDWEAVYTAVKGNPGKF